MKTKLLLLTALLTTSLFYSQEAFTEHLINQPLSNPVQVQSADIDGDGDMDMAAVSTGGELTWHEQISNTNWKTHYIAMDVEGYSLAIADLDEDGNMDIIVTHRDNNSSNGVISWFKNDGNQNFTQSVLANSNIASGSNKTIVIDIDHDGDKDVISSVSGSIIILRNDGSENFTNESTNINLGNGSLGVHSNDIEIIDFDKDGLLDFLVATRGDDGINWYKQNNDHTFTNNTIASGTFVNMTVGDIDNDGDYDIVVTKDNNTSGAGNEVIVYNNSGDNLNFTSSSIFSLNPSSDNTLLVNLFDVDNDNDLDLIYLSSEFNNHGFKARLNNNGVFSNSETIIYLSDIYNVASSNNGEFILEDINLDNKIDIVQVNISIGRINYYQNNDINAATNNFSSIEVSNSSGNVYGISVADFNNDNKLDIVASSFLESTIEWFNNTGDNLKFSTHLIEHLPRANNYKNKSVDIDGDGLIDILSINFNGDIGGVLWYKNNGDQTFTKNTILNGQFSDISYADFDNDSDIDILAVSDRKIRIFINDGHENFNTSILYSRSIDYNLTTATTVDVNNDNLLDIVFLGDNRNLGFLLNNGNSSFSSFVSFQNSDGTDYQLPVSLGIPLNFEFADIDNDNDLDLFGIGSHLFYLKNNGSNQIEEETILVSQSQFGSGRDLQITDIDNDNDLDVIVSGDFGVYWAKNDNLSFTRELLTSNYNTNANAFGVEIVDMDNDGDTDIIYSSSSGNKVAWLENKIDEQTTSIPDSNFEQALIDLGFDTNGLNGNILLSDAQAIDTLRITDPANNSLLPNVSEKIADLTGIQEMTNLKWMDAANNNLSNIDLSKNLALTVLGMTGNSLTNLDVLANVNLERLYARDNQLTSLDISNNTKLIRLVVNGNQLSNIDISNAPDLEWFMVYHNQITTVDFSNNPKITSILMWDNQAATIDVSNLTDLKYLVINDNNISSINLSNNTELIEFYAENNNFTSIDVSQNTSLEYLDLANNNVTDIDVSKNTALTLLNCENNNLSNIDISNNLELTDLYIRSNQLTSIDVSNNDKLIDFEVSRNQLTAVYVSANTALEYLNVGFNQLTSIDLSTNVNLETYYGSVQGTMNHIDFSNSPNLKIIHVNACNLTSINIKNGNNTVLEEFEAKDNTNLQCVEVNGVSVANTKDTDGKWDIGETAVYNTDCSQLLGVSDFENSANNIEVYPNPVTHILNIQSVHTVNEVSLFNVLGKRVYTSKNSSTISMEKFPKGVYFLQLITDKKIIVTKKVIKK